MPLEKGELKPGGARAGPEDAWSRRRLWCLLGRNGSTDVEREGFGASKAKLLEEVNFGGGRMVV